MKTLARLLVILIVSLLFHCLDTFLGFQLGLWLTPALFTFWITAGRFSQAKLVYAQRVNVLRTIKALRPQAGALLSSLVRKFSRNGPDS